MKRIGARLKRGSGGHQDPSTAGGIATDDVAFDAFVAAEVASHPPTREMFGVP